MKSSRRKSYKKRRPYAKRRPTGLSSSWPFPKRNNIILPQRVGIGLSGNTDLKTSFFINVAAAGSGVFTGFLKPGSAFDPCGDLSNIQPAAYDAWASVFNRYKVNKAWITITISGNNTQGAGSSQWVAAAYPAVDSTALTTYQGAASQPYSKTFFGVFAVSNNVAGSVTTGTGGSSCTRKFVLDNEAIVGSIGDSFDGGALVTSDPTVLQYAVLPIFIQSQTAATATWLIKVDIIQNVTFSQRKNIVDA